MKLSVEVDDSLMRELRKRTGESDSAAALIGAATRWSNGDALAKSAAGPKSRVEDGLRDRREVIEKFVTGEWRVALPQHHAEFSDRSEWFD